MFFQSNTLALLFTLCSLSSLVLSVPHDHGPVLGKRLPAGNWYQRDNHPAHALFKRGKRDTTSDGITYPTVGSPEWYAAYPPAKPDPSKLPQEWIDALNAAIKDGKIPNIPPSTPTGGNPTYGNLDPMSDQVCSTTYKCRKNNDTWDAPDGVWGASFDDGPLPTSDRLYDFLKQNEVHATHFFIGVNILNNPKEFTRAFDELEDDIAVHTWTHPYMTTLDNMALLGEFGWTLEIIHNSTGGRLPKYWRPPYGDSDNRVSAIAKEVFGLQTVIWNQDTEDWSIGESGGATPQGVNQSLTKWITGPKSPGLIILEHELSNYTVQAFIDAFPLIKQNNWNIISVAELDGGSAYHNADGDDGTVTAATSILEYGDNSAPPADSGNNSSSGAPGPSGSPAPSGSSHSAGPTAGSRQATDKGSGTSNAPQPTGANQTNGASSAMAVFGTVRGIFAATATLLLSAIALA